MPKFAARLALDLELARFEKEYFIALAKYICVILEIQKKIFFSIHRVIVAALWCMET